MTQPTHPAKSQTEARILSSAAELFARSGFHGVSTRDIAVAADVNEVTIYRHYPRKRDLCLAVLESELQRLNLRGDVLTGLAEAATAHDALQRSFDLIAETLEHRPELLRILQYSSLELNEELGPMLRRHFGALLEVIASYLRPWVEKGAIRCTNAKTLVFLLVSIVVSRAPVNQVFAGEPATPRELFAELAQCCIR